MFHRFSVRQEGPKLEIQRLPEEGVAITHGWETHLRFHCCR